MTWLPISLFLWFVILLVILEPNQNDLSRIVAFCRGSWSWLLPTVVLTLFGAAQVLEIPRLPLQAIGAALSSLLLLSRLSGLFRRLRDFYSSEAYVRLIPDEGRRYAPLNRLNLLYAVLAVIAVLNVLDLGVVIELTRFYASVSLVGIAFYALVWWENEKALAGR